MAESDFVVDLSKLEVSLPTRKEPSVRKPICVDVCSGLKGFSQPFIDAGWKVITIDIEPKFEPTMVADITQIDWSDFKRKYLHGMPPYLLLASPPCERFSIACRTWPKMGIKKAMEIVGACFEAVAVLKPRYWVIENPMGRLRWFLGKPGTTIRQCDYGAPYQKKTDLWTNIILPLLDGEKEAKFWVFKEGHFNAKNPKPTFKHYSPIALSGVGKGKAERARLPYGLGQAILKTISEKEVQKA